MYSALMYAVASLLSVVCFVLALGVSITGGNAFEPLALGMLWLIYSKQLQRGV